MGYGTTTLLRQGSLPPANDCVAIVEDRLRPLLTGADPKRVKTKRSIKWKKGLDGAEENIGSVRRTEKNSLDIPFYRTSELPVTQALTAS